MNAVLVVFYRTITEADKQLVDKDVIVEEDCWIGTRVVLLMGVTVRRGTTVAAGAVVSKSTAPYSIVGGTPATSNSIGQLIRFWSMRLYYIQKRRDIQRNS